MHGVRRPLDIGARGRFQDFEDLLLRTTKLRRDVRDIRRDFLDRPGGDLQFETSVFEIAYRERLRDQFGCAVVRQIDDVVARLDTAQHRRQPSGAGIELECVAEHGDLLPDFGVDRASESAVAHGAIDAARGFAASKRVKQDVLGLGVFHQFVIAENAFCHL